MTAVNLIVRDRAAYLITDTARYHGDGIVMEFGSKVVRSNRLRMAIATNGVISSDRRDEFDAWLKTRSTQAEAMTALPRMALDIEIENRRNKHVGNMAGDMEPFVQLFIAMWHERLGPTGWILCASEGTFGASYTPGTPRRVDRVLSPPVDHALCPDEGFGARKHGVLIAQAQRQHLDHTGVHRVGGRAELTVVDTAGVRTQTLCKWPDRIGERIAA